ncbi:hypothetical protein FRC07_004556 [Ceratobasidium sp. 392]|nr:hypothetical protein FRC07_004556 [Ceratobasidium sp. 392]
MGAEADPQYDRFIPELRVDEYAERYLRRSDSLPGRFGGTEQMRMTYRADVSEQRASGTITAVDYTGLPGSTHYYQPPGTNEQTLQNTMSSSTSPSTIHDDVSPTSPIPTHAPSTFALHSSYREPTTAHSPADTDSPTSLYPGTQALKLSASPVTVLSPLDSDAADSPLSDSYHARHTSPSRSPSTSEPVIAEPPSSSTNEADVMTENPAGARAKSVDSVSHGHSAMGPIRRGNSAGDRGKSAAGNIRVQRPAGIKWNQRTRCAYINPVTGLQCRTSAGRGPDLERHLRTVHLREEARAVSDGLIPRDKAGLLPSDWVMGDRLDFDCPHCAVRFTREDARDRHVKVQHQA